MYTFSKTSFFFVKKIIFLSRISRNIFFFALFCRKKKRWKMAIFDKNHGLTRLENFDIFDFFKTSFSMSTKHSFVSRISRNSLSCLILRKKNCLAFSPSPSFCGENSVWLFAPLKSTSKVHFPWGKTNLKESSMGGKHSMGWDGSILFLFPWGRGGATFQRYVWGGLVCYTAVFSVVTQRFGWRQ